MILALVFLVSFVHAETFAGKTEMNGISYKEYEGFDKKWEFLTVRYRTDTSEQRFVYANPVAARALKAGVVDYPDGAVFAKIGFVTEEDPAFKSSRVPSGAVRYQFMVRDKKKYATTGGWGYALFDANKTTYEGDFKTQAAACYACHQLVPKRGEVFSTALKISAFAPLPAANAAASEVVPDIPQSLKFATVSARKLPEMIRRSLPEGAQVRSVVGSLRDHVFRGTIDEIRPSLVAESRRSGKVAALVASDNLQFSAVYPDKRKDCPREKSFKAVFSMSVPSHSASPYTVVAWQDLCE